MRWICPNQHRRRCRRRDDAVGCLVHSRTLRLLTCCCQNTRRRLWQRMSNTSKRRRGWWTMLQSYRLSKTETTRARYMLILVLMLIRYLRKSRFDRRHMEEAALAMRDVMSREEEPSFVIRDPRYVKKSTNCTSLWHIFNGRWLVGLGVIAMSLVFATWFASPQGWLLPVLSELLGARAHMEQRWRCHPRNRDQWAGIHRAVSRGYNGTACGTLGGRLRNWRTRGLWIICEAPNEILSMGPRVRGDATDCD